MDAFGECVRNSEPFHDERGTADGFSQKERKAQSPSTRTETVHRRTFLATTGSLATAGTIATAGCLTTLGVTERGPVTAKWITATTDTDTRRLVYDSTDGERYVAEAHETDFPDDGRMFVSQDLHRRLNARYGVVEYRLRHECADCGSPSVSRGDFNSVAGGDVAELTYSESGERATIVGVEQNR